MTTAARPGGLIPEHLWLADDHDTLVVSVLAPEVAGNARHDTTGPVTVISPYWVCRLGAPDTIRPGLGLRMPRSGGARIGWMGAAGSVSVAAAGVWAVGLWTGLAVAAVGLGVTVWQALRRYTRVARQWTEGHQVLTHYADRTVLRAAVHDVRYIVSAWPQLNAHVDLDDPAPVLVSQLWDITVLVGELATARELCQQPHSAGYGVPDGTTTAAELADRIDRAGTDLTRLTADVDQRLAHLRRLSSEVARLVTEQQALVQANAMGDVDQRRGLPTPAADATVDLADYTTAVLAAYRELAQPPRPTPR
jgi:hypothetical protein